MTIEQDQKKLDLLLKKEVGLTKDRDTANGALTVKAKDLGDLQKEVDKLRSGLKAAESKLASCVAERTRLQVKVEKARTVQEKRAKRRE